MTKIFISVPLMTLLVGCSRSQAPVAQIAAPAQTISETRWSDRTELFIEYPPLVVGSKGRAAVHFTSIATFKPVAEGGVTIELKKDNQVAQSFETAGPSSPGIFGVDLEPRQAGKYLLVVSLRAPKLDDSHELGEVTVFDAPEKVTIVSYSPQQETIPFLKEQQWTLDFATESAIEREIRESLRVAGEVRPRSGGEAGITAPISGRVASSPVLPVVGQMVSQGQPVAALIPPTPVAGDLPALELALADAQGELEIARHDRERVDRLLEVGAIPAWRQHHAQVGEARAAARVKAAEERLDQYKVTRAADGAPSDESLFVVRAPISGVVTNILATSGKNAGQGDTLLHVVAVDRVYVVANVPEADAGRISQLTGAEIELAGASAIPAQRVVSVSRWIDPSSRTLSVIYEVGNSQRRFAIGQSLPIRLFLSQASKTIAVPEGAIIDDGGRPVAFVQVAGESFARRAVRLGFRASGYVQILEGVQKGERIVTKGAYLIRLAALSPQIPPHGHVH